MNDDGVLQRGELEQTLANRGVSDVMKNAWLDAFDTVDGDVGKRDFAEFFRDSVDSSSDTKLSVNEIKAALGAAG